MKLIRCFWTITVNFVDRQSLWELLIITQEAAASPWQHDSLEQFVVGEYVQGHSSLFTHSILPQLSSAHSLNQNCNFKQLSQFMCYPS